MAADYVQTVNVPEQLPNVLDRAIRTALSQRAPTALIIPADVQELPYSPPTHAFKMVPSSLGLDLPQIAPDDDAVRRAADILNAGSKVAMLVGAGARGAHAELAEVADLLGAGAAKALLGKDVLSDEQPWVTGSIGLLGTRPSYEMMTGCDTLLTVGSSFPYSQFMPGYGQARGVQIDIDARFVGMRYPYEVNLVADARAALRALVGDDGHAGSSNGRPGQSAALLLRALPDPARRRDRHRRFRIGRQLVCAPTPFPRRHSGFAVGDAGDDGSRRRSCGGRRRRREAPTLQRHRLPAIDVHDAVTEAAPRHLVAKVRERRGEDRVVVEVHGHHLR